MKSSHGRWNHVKHIETVCQRFRYRCWAETYLHSIHLTQFTRQHLLTQHVPSLSDWKYCTCHKKHNAVHSAYWPTHGCGCWHFGYSFCASSRRDIDHRKLCPGRLPHASPHFPHPASSSHKFFRTRISVWSIGCKTDWLGCQHQYRSPTEEQQ